MNLAGAHSLVQLYVHVKKCTTPTIANPYPKKMIAEAQYIDAEATQQQEFR